MNLHVANHLRILGKRVEDRVMGVVGVAESVCFDLYGCVQVCVNCGLEADGKRRESIWLDISRLKVVDENPVMLPPDWEFGPVAEGRHGPAEKPAREVFR